MRHSARFLAIGVVFLVGMGSLAAQQATTVEGTLVDAKCYLGNNALTGNDHGMQACGTMCLKMGVPAGILAQDNTFHAIIASAGDLAEYVGQTVRVSGTLNNGAILAQTVEVNTGGSWQSIKLSGMM